MIKGAGDIWTAQFMALINYSNALPPNWISGDDSPAIGWFPSSVVLLSSAHQAAEREEVLVGVGPL